MAGGATVPQSSKKRGQSTPGHGQFTLADGGPSNVTLVDQYEDLFSKKSRSVQNTLSPYMSDKNLKKPVVQSLVLN